MNTVIQFPPQTAISEGQTGNQLLRPLYFFKQRKSMYIHTRSLSVTSKKLAVKIKMPVTMGKKDV